MGCSQSATAGEGNAQSKNASLVDSSDIVDWKCLLTEGFDENNYSRYAADYLQSCLNAKNDVYVIEVVCILEEQHISTLCSTYDAKYSKKLVDAISDVCNPDVAGILCGMLGKKEVASAEDTSEISSKMVDAIASDNLFENEKLFQHILQSRSRNDMKVILELFLKKCQRDICVEIEKKYPSGKTKEGFLTFAQLIRNPHLYLAEKINALLSYAQVEEQRHLAFLLLSQNEENMKIIKDNYRSTYFEALSLDIREHVKDDALQKALLNVVGRG